MTGVCYSLWSSASGGDSNNLATLDILRKGRIVGVAIHAMGLGSGTGYVGLQVALNKGTNDITTNNSPRESNLLSTVYSHNTNGVVTVNDRSPNISVPIEVGDRISLHSELISGSAASTGFCKVDIWAIEA